MPVEPRPKGGIGMRLHIFPPDTTARRRRIRLLLVALVAVAAWGVVSARRNEIGLADYRTAATELVVEMPYLIAASPAVVAALLKAAMPRDPPPAWFAALLDRIRSFSSR